VLQAYVDDSGNFRQQRTSLLAGLVASADAWVDFSDRWNGVLRAAPSIEYFKMSEAFARVKNFAGFSEDARDAKVDQLVDVILGTDIRYSASVVMINADYRAVQGATDSLLKDPYYFLFSTIIQACLLHQYRNRMTEQVDFIFDMSAKPKVEIDNVFKQTMFTGFEDVKALQLVANLPYFVTTNNSYRFRPLTCWPVKSVVG
jgi:hypothetical protein